MMITLEQVKKLVPSYADKETLVSLLNKHMEFYGISTPKRISMFLTQALHESSSFTKLEENLYYKTGDRIYAVFPKQFRDAKDAADYAKNPEKLANKIYDNRMGNGDEKSGEGWKYRGRGIFQLTGKSNYYLFSRDCPEYDCIKNPDILKDIDAAIKSACWYWNRNGLNKFADSDDLNGCTRAINGGLIGMDKRTEMWSFVKTIIK